MQLSVIGKVLLYNVVRMKVDLWRWVSIEVAPELVSFRVESCAFLCGLACGEVVYLSDCWRGIWVRRLFAMSAWTTVTATATAEPGPHLRRRSHRRLEVHLVSEDTLPHLQSDVSAARLGRSGFKQL